MDKLEIKDLSFEEALKELENIISQLEAGEVPLDEAITLYDRGSDLKKYCELKLQSAEEKIQKISQKKLGSKDLKVEDIQK
ncbi:MAG: exodeoxyribonuclease VII small subunit [Rhodobacteraceae bacterium]|nr:exodeoxyribonuclease VII small subunit [Paracoccaceae bacterium]|tara:strand:- start:187 stop:429 length:243 start_codon:yes stop_codon:yes gene_type:complete